MLKKAKKYLYILIGCTILIQSTAHAVIDYKKNESYYQELCAKRSSFNANKSACEGFEKYLNDQKEKNSSNQEAIKKAIENTKGDINKVLNVLKMNDKLIKNKTSEIVSIKKDIQLSEKEIKKLEEDLLARLVLMQEINTDNFIIDFLTSSTSLDDFLTKLSGITAINQSNEEVALDLKDQRQKLTTKKDKLITEEKQLKEAKKEQDALLKEYRSKESQLFAKLESERKAQANFNKKLDGLNINDIEEELNNKPTNNNNNSNNNDNNNNSNNNDNNNSTTSSGLIIPVAHSTVTATAWYYPQDFGGGWHPGIDLANSYNTRIFSPGKGVVLLQASEGGGYGNYMVTAHQVGADTYTILYGHLNSFANPGSTLSQGETIGYMGSTGNSTGPHVHVEIIKHKSQSLSKVINKYKNSYDIYFGLGYSGIGSCSSAGSVCRLKPQQFWGLSYMQSF